MQQAGPAIFPIDEAKDHCHGINPVVDAEQVAAFMFHGHFVPDEIDVVEPKSGFVGGALRRELAISCWRGDPSGRRSRRSARPRPSEFDRSTAGWALIPWELFTLMSRAPWLAACGNYNLVNHWPRN